MAVQYRIDGDSSGLERAARDGEQSLGRLGSAAKRSGQAMADAGRRSGAAMKAAGSAMASGVAVAGVAFAAVATDAVKLANDISESTSKNSVLFGKQAKEAQKFAATSAKSFGISKRAALEFTGTFGNLMRAQGIGQKQAAKTSVAYTKLAADLASFNNTSIADAAQAIKSGLTGETEPLRAYGVVLSATSIAAEALAKGIVKPKADIDAVAQKQIAATRAAEGYGKAVRDYGEDSRAAALAAKTQDLAERKLAEAMKGKVPELNAQQKLLATQSLIYKQTANAQGDFARTSDGLANRQRILSARFEDSRAALGAKLLPTVTAAAGALLSFMDAVESGKGPIGGFVRDLREGMGQAIERIGPLVRQAVPVVVGAVMAIAAGVEELRPAFMYVAKWVQTYLLPAFAELRPVVVGIVGLVRGAMPEIKATIADVVPIMEKLGQAIVALSWLFAQMFKAALPAIKQTLGGLIQIVRGIVQVIDGILNGDFSRIWEGVKRIFSGALRAIGGIIKANIASVRAIAESFGLSMSRPFINLPETLSSLVSKAFSAVLAQIKLFTAPGRLAARAVVSGVVGAWNGISAVGSKVKDGFGEALDFIKGLPSTFGKAARDTVGAFGRGFTGLGKAIADGLGDIMGGIPNVARGIADWINDHTILDDSWDPPGPLPKITFPALAGGGRIGGRYADGDQHPIMVAGEEIVLNPIHQARLRAGETLDSVMSSLPVIGGVWQGYKGGGRGRKALIPEEKISTKKAKEKAKKKAAEKAKPKPKTLGELAREAIDRASGSWSLTSGKLARAMSVAEGTKSAADDLRVIEQQRAANKKRLTQLAALRGTRGLSSADKGSLYSEEAQLLSQQQQLAEQAKELRKGKPYDGSKANDAWAALGADLELAAAKAFATTSKADDVKPMQDREKAVTDRLAYLAQLVNKKGLSQADRTAARQEQAQLTTEKANLGKQIAAALDPANAASEQWGFAGSAYELDKARAASTFSTADDMDVARARQSAVQGRASALGEYLNRTDITGEDRSKAQGELAQLIAELGSLREELDPARASASQWAYDSAVLSRDAARAASTTDKADDIAVAKAREARAQARYDELQATIDGEASQAAKTAAISEQAQLIGEITALRESVDHANKLAEAQGDLAAAIREETAAADARVAKIVGTRDTLMASLAAMFSGEIGGQLSLASATPGTPGQVAKY